MRDPTSYIHIYYISSDGVCDAKITKIASNTGYFKLKQNRIGIISNVKFQKHIEALSCVAMYKYLRYVLTFLDWNETKRVVLCLKRTILFKLKLGNDKIGLVVYSAVEDQGDSKFHSGHGKLCH